ncbi:unnamed protein product [Oppiella nova]|uniref:Nuclear receptor domain-containing protein n=1 Tax=Oppiella nova TaxID=334625 RepID=A0A7R9LB28_9ACAR|nr:unnamed protein product [Oppiella nova]CAG2161705.1 unnamed protein product [Oppiella nova]
MSSETGYHFKAISCESCKSFFRRNALRNADSFNCYLGGNCSINVETRKWCKKCRLDKCLAVGMKTKLIFTDKQNEVRKRIVEENRENKRKVMDKSRDDSVLNSTTSPPPDVLNMEINISPELSDSTSLFIDSNELISNEIIPIVRPITDHRNQFNELESNRLSELLGALKCKSTDQYLYHKKFLQNMGLDYDSDTIIIELLLYSLTQTDQI